MGTVTFRRNKFIIGSEWYCNPKCPQWPQHDYFETTFLDLQNGDRLCDNCLLYTDKPPDKPADKKPRKVA